MVAGACWVGWGFWVGLGQLGQVARSDQADLSDRSDQLGLADQLDLADLAGLLDWSGWRDHAGLVRWVSRVRRRLFRVTATLLKAMNNPAQAGLSSSPVQGIRIPAARGIPRML